MAWHTRLFKNQMKPEFSAFSLFSPPTLTFYSNQTSFDSLNFLSFSELPSLLFYACLLGLFRTFPDGPDGQESLQTTGLLKAQIKFDFIHDTCLGYSGILAHLLPLPIPSATVNVSPWHIIIDCFISFHLMISFYSYLAPSLFFPFLKCLCVLIPQLEVKTMRVESHCVFLLVRDQEIC